MRVPSGLQAAEFVQSVSVVRVWVVSPVAASHMWTPRGPVVRMRVPSGLQAAEFVRSVVRVWVVSPVVASHVRTPLSSVVRKRVPSGLQTTRATMFRPG